MQIHLKQPEIIAALRMYVAAQGISLQGKNVDMAFTAGRGASGISVEISIEESQLPLLSDDDMTERARPVLAAVATTQLSPADILSLDKVKEAKVEVTLTSADKAITESQDKQEIQEGPVIEDQQVKPKASLFG